MRESVHFALVAVPKAASGAFLIGLNLALVRYLDPSEYGRFALSLTILLLADAILGGPFDLAVLRLSGERSTQTAQRRINAGRAALHIKVASFLLLSLAVAIAAYLVDLGFRRDAPLFAAIVFATVAVLTFRSILMNLQVDGRFGAYSASESLQFGLRVIIVAAVMISLEPSAATIIVALGTASLLATVWAALRYEPVLLRLSEARTLPYREIVTATHLLLPTIAVGALIGRLDMLLLASLSSDAVLGIFAAGQMIATVFELAGSYLQIVITPHLTASLQNGSIRALYRTGQTWIAILSLSAFVLLALLWNYTASLVLPAEYAASAQVALILMPAAALAMATIPLALPLVMLHRALSLFVFDIALLPFVVGAYIVVIPEYGVNGAAFLTAATMIVRSLYVQFVAVRIVRAFRG